MSLLLWILGIWIGFNVAIVAAMHFKPLRARRRRAAATETLVNPDVLGSYGRFRRNDLVATLKQQLDRGTNRHRSSGDKAGALHEQA
jgi:hypothetical protein